MLELDPDPNEMNADPQPWIVLRLDGKCPLTFLMVSSLQKNPLILGLP
jgi:hypothetical protein